MGHTSGIEGVFLGVWKQGVYLQTLRHFLYEGDHSSEVDVCSEMQEIAVSPARQRLQSTATLRCVYSPLYAGTEGRGRQLVV